MSGISEQIRERINRINERNPYYVVVAVVILVLVVFYVFPLQFQLSTLQAINPKIAQLSSEVAETKNNIIRLQQIKKELSRLEDKYENLNRRIKTKESVPFLLENISRIAAKNNVKIDQIMPQAAGDVAVLENKEGKYYSIPIVIDAQSGYHDFGRFLNELEIEGLFLRLPSFSITENAAGTRPCLVHLILELVVFEKN